MGIFGALTTAVAGLTSQSYALENISGNIANSKTTGYKRVDTTFADIVMSVGQASTSQSSGSVLALSRPTNTLGGPVEASKIATHMAINGDGYFRVQAKVGETDGTTVFSNASVYARRGDFVLDKEGYLVNGSGYFLEGIPVDSATGNPIGDVSSILKLSTGLLPARASTVINYSGNLPATPRVGVLDRSSYSTDPTLQNAVPAKVATLTAPSTYTPINLSANVNNELSFDVNGTTVTLTQADAGADKIVSLAEALVAITAQLPAGVSVAQGSGANTGKLVFSTTATGSGAQVAVNNIAVGGTGITAVPSNLGFGNSGGAANGKNALSAGAGIVTANDFGTFQKQSLEGGTTTLYDQQGNAVNMQFRWAKVATSPETWNLYYQNDSKATGSGTQWTNVGKDFVFNSAGKLTAPSLGSISIPNVDIEGRQLGSLDFKFPGNSITQYASSQGNASVTLDQNGYASGSLTSVGVADGGRITASYTNGQQIDVAKVPLYQFNGDSGLQRLDGGAFRATRESGVANLMTEVNISGQALEGSNTDIAEEYSKMIVTQQAYSANSRVITTASDMMKEVLNIVR